MKNALSLIAVFTAYMLSQETADAAIPVYDGALLSENIRQRIDAVEHFNALNAAQLNQIALGEMGNDIAAADLQLMSDNMRMDHKQQWGRVKEIGESTLALLYASEAAWSEFGSAQNYYASYIRADAWEQCFKGGRCTFAEALKRLDESSIRQALQAYDISVGMSDRLKQHTAVLKAMSFEGSESVSLAGTLDTLSKITGIIASSVTELNAQIALTNRLYGHETAGRHEKEIADEAALKAINTSRERKNGFMKFRTVMPNF